MDPRKAIGLGIVCILVGLLIGFLLWGPRSDRLAGELAQVKARLAEATQQLEERQRQEQRQGQLEAELKRAQSDLQELKKDLQLERQRRQKLEQLLSEGRK